MSAKAPIPTFGLTHIALGVRDPKESFEFYRRVFGMVAVFSDENLIQAQTPGARDVLVFERKVDRIGESGSIAHFGFRLRNPDAIDEAIAGVVDAGGTVIESGEFCPGEPYAFVRDIDGYTVEIWYELPTPIDPV